MPFTKVDTKLFKTGEIKFSDLRSNFKDTTSGSISFSELYRSTADSAYVPDALENLNIPTSGTIQSSNFRNSIKELKIVQGVSDVDENITTNSTDIINLFNSYNKDKNLRKTIEINGTLGATTSIDNGAFYHNDPGYKNLRLLISSTGKVYGKGGSPSGAGGNAIRTTSTLSVINNGLIYAGGGGGGTGGTGGTGGQGGAGSYQQYVPQTCTKVIPQTCTQNVDFLLSGRNISWNKGKYNVGGYANWGGPMNNHAISFRISNANGQSDSASGSFTVPAPGTYTVRVAADNAEAGGYCIVNGVSCAIGPLTGFSETNVYMSGTVPISIQIRNSYEPPDAGGNDFNKNPMGMAIRIKGQFTSSFDCSYTQTYDCSYYITVNTSGGSGGAGGSGGTGGKGRGYDYQSPQSLAGSSGSSGSSGSAGGTNAGTGGSGGQGGTGGSGGDWGTAGSSGATGINGNNGSSGNVSSGSAGGSGSSGGSGGAAGYYIYGVGVTFTNNGTVKGQFLNV